MIEPSAEMRLEVTSAYLRDALEEITLAFGLPIAYEDGAPFCNGSLVHRLTDHAHQLAELFEAMA